MWKSLTISLLCLSALVGCTTPSVRVVVVPNDRVLEKVYDQHGQLVPGRSSISDGWVRELAQDLEKCAKDVADAKPLDAWNVERAEMGYWPGVSVINLPVLRKKADE